MPKLARKIESGITFENRSLAEPCRTLLKCTAEYRAYHCAERRTEEEFERACRDSELRAKQKSSLQSTRRF